MASEPAAQAVQVELRGPVEPSSSDTCAAPMLGIIMGTSSGLVRSGPFSMRFSISLCNVCRPPTPLPTTAPTRSGSARTSTAASSAAIFAAATAYRENRSRRRTLRLSMNRSGSKSLTSAAMWTLWSVWSKRVISPTPDSPDTRRRQKVSTSLPSGETTPRPVTTTLRCAVMPVPSVRQMPSPPSTGSVTPVMYRACGDARKTTAPATSSVVPMLLSGVLSTMSLRVSSGRAWVMGVSM